MTDIAPVVTTAIDTGQVNLPKSQTLVGETPGSQPNVVVNLISPMLAIFVRFVNVFLTTLVGLVTASLATDIIPASDFVSLVWKCAQLSVAGAGLGLLKDLVTIFGRLESKYPLLTGSV